MYSPVLIGRIISNDGTQNDIKLVTASGFFSSRFFEGAVTVWDLEQYGMGRSAA